MIPSKNIKIKILSQDDFRVDQSKQQYFKQLFDRAQEKISENEKDYNLNCSIVDNIINYQHWKFQFKGQGQFEGRQIGGVLMFSSNHPQDPPKFYFDPVIENGVQTIIQHENIYGDRTLCLPLINKSIWNPQSEEYEILEAIEDIFHNPNWGEGDAPANPQFVKQTKEQKVQIQQRQAKCLPNFVKQD